MFWHQFWQNRERLEKQYQRVDWDAESGLEPRALEARAEALTERLTAQGLPKPLIKARLFALVLDQAQLAAEPCDLLQDHIRHGFLVQAQRRRWMEAEMGGALKAEAEEARRLHALGVGDAHCDFGHTVPDWGDILNLGIPGLLARLRDARERLGEQGKLTGQAEVFYEASEIVYEAVLRYLRRLGAVCRRRAQAETPVNRARLAYCAQDLEALAEQAPATLHQALQLAYVFHILQEEIEGERLRSLGGLDRLYARFMRLDLDAGRLTRETLAELWQHLFQKFHALTGDTFYGEPMYLGGELPDGSCAVSEFTYEILRAYDALSIANPKFHIRISENTPPEFLRTVLDCVRRGNSSFVFISDACAIPMMMEKVGATLAEARDYVPVGCYEPGVLGREVACTGNGGISLPKALELALNNGVDPLSGEKLGPETGEAASLDTFDKLLDAVKAQIAFLADRMTGLISAFERRYMEMNPSPLFSGTLAECVEQGRDAYAGGAKYNSSSLYGYGNGTTADALAMIRKLVYDCKEMTLAELNGALKSDWKDQELLRLRLRRDSDKWGNNRALPDAICRAICDCFAGRVNRTPNARGGRFKAALFTIDFNYYYGQRLGATADGRRAGEPISRNTGASSAMDRSGVTALIASVTKLDLRQFPTGSVLDLMLHPTAVAGAEGLEAFARLVETYFEKGGFAIHGNVLDAAVLRAAQQDPQAYSNLQVRVCGWNVYFVNLSRAEQDEFIARAEA